MYRAETLAEPYYTFRRKGYAVAFASVAGGPIPIDPYSLSPTIMKNYSIKTFMYDSKTSSSVVWCYVQKKQDLYNQHPYMSQLLDRLAWQHICLL